MDSQKRSFPDDDLTQMPKYRRDELPEQMPSPAQRTLSHPLPPPLYKRTHPHDDQPRKKIFYNHPTPGKMANRRANVRQVLKQFNKDQLEKAFNEYRITYRNDYDITPEDFRNIATAYHGGKIRHKKHVYSYKKRSMNKKRAKSGHIVIVEP